VVKALLEVGGCDLAIMTRNDGVSCLYMSAENGHPDVVQVDDGVSCLLISAANGHLENIGPQT
jgi:hypothetical protein